MKKRAFSDYYEDIIGLSRPVSAERKRMPAIERAAQFSPFAALTGHQDAVQETERLTDRRMELTEDQKTILNEKLNFLLNNLSQNPEVTIFYFLPDEKKAGGSYVNVTGTIRKFDETGHFICLSDGTKISIEDISGIAGEIFNKNFIS